MRVMWDWRGTERIERNGTVVVVAKKEFSTKGPLSGNFCCACTPHPAPGAPVSSRVPRGGLATGSSHRVSYIDVLRAVLEPVIAVDFP